MKLSALVVPSQMHEHIAKTSIGRRARGLEINGGIPLLCVRRRRASRQFRLWRGGSFSLWGPQHVFKRGWPPRWAAPTRAVRHRSIAPLRVGHGAQVALLRCPIPRDGIHIIPRCEGEPKGNGRHRSANRETLPERMLRAIPCSHSGRGDSIVLAHCVGGRKAVNSMRMADIESDS